MKKKFTDSEGSDYYLETYTVTINVYQVLGFLLTLTTLKYIGLLPFIPWWAIALSPVLGWLSLILLTWIVAFFKIIFIKIFK